MKPDFEMFDRRSPLITAWGEAETSPLEAVLRQRLRAGLGVTDLIGANPHDHDLQYPAERLAEIVPRAAAASLRFEPDPAGRLPAREAVAQYHGGELSPESVVLTPGTSLAYFYIFRLLHSGPGDSILCPYPTYPLFDDLARLAGMGTRRYHLERSVGPGSTVRWTVDPEELRFQASAPGVRAIALVSPHNPTGTVTNRAEIQMFADTANRLGVPLIMDEVFREFVLDPATPVPRPAEHGSRLSITLNGISKMLSLPGLKGGWIAVEGDAGLTRPLINALHYVSDTFLPVSEITQSALPDLLGSTDVIGNLSAEYRARTRRALDALAGHGVAVDVPESAPYLCYPLRDGSGAGEQLAEKLLTQAGIHMHPGTHYGLPPNYLVSTSINRELADMAPVLARLLD